MPCPHNEITIVQRSQRQSAVAAAAYQSGEKLFCEYDQQVKHYPEKRGIVHNEILLPANAPRSYADRNTLWNAAEAVEKQWNSQLARRWVLTIPREIPPDQYAVLVREFCEQQFVSKGMIVDFAIHDPHPPGHNPHAHVLLTMRAMDEHGKWLPKSRKVYDFDENGERIKLLSGRWKSHKEDTVDWNDQKYCEIWRHEWEGIQNRYLEANDRPERVDLRSYARQGLDIIPTVHEGVAVRQMEKRGIQTNIGNLNREIRAANRLMKSIRQLMFKEAADIKTSDQLHLPVPEAKFETVVVKPSEIQQDMVKSLSERAAEVHSGAVDPSVDNMLKITSDGRKIGLDQRLMNPLTPDDPDSKLNACVDNVLRIWNETKEDNLTQLIFCDMSTPKGDGSFNVYDDIRTKLLAAGVPESEVEFIHNADTEGKKADLFSKVRSGKVRVLLGSTAKMGAGTNVQTLLVAVHHLDVGWRPSDMTQRNGRIIRQGNKNKQVYVYNYVTEGTFDAYLWQTLENKQKFISQIMTSKSPMRSCDDVDEQALSYAEVKALCAGDPRIREKMDLDVQVAKLKVLRSDYQNQKYRLEDKLLKHYPEEIQKAKNRIAALKNDAQIADAHPQDKENFCGMTIKGMVFDEKKAAGERLMLACKEMPNADMMLLGTYRGFELNIRFDSFKNEHQIVLRGELSYPVPLGDDPRGNIVRLDNAIGNFADRIADADAALDSLEQQKQAAEVEIAKPFAQEEELQTKSARLAELDALLNMEHQSSRTEPEAEEKPDARPSVLAALEEKADKVEPVRPFKSYLDKDGDAR